MQHCKVLNWPRTNVAIPTTPSTLLAVRLAGVKMRQGRLRYVVVPCGGRHLRLASTPSQTKIWEFFASKGNAEHRCIEFHQRGKTAGISLGYEIERNSMVLQLISENIHFLSGLLTRTLSGKVKSTSGGQKQKEPAWFNKLPAGA